MLVIDFSHAMQSKTHTVLDKESLPIAITLKQIGYLH